MQLLQLLLGACVISALVMSVAYRDAIKRDKLDGVDIGWAAAIVLSSWWYLGISFQSRSMHPSAVVSALLVTVWGVRLMHHLYRDRVLRSSEDGRYRELKRGWGAQVSRNVKIFFAAQSVLAVIFSLVVLAACRAENGSLPSIAVSVVLFVCALLGLATADRQLARFRADPANRGQVCAVGWWRYSRHPNYFFEWMLWLSYVPLAADRWWIALIPALLLLVLLLFVTGIPPTEAQSLRSRGEAYREYQRTTSAFLPLPRWNRRP